MRPGLRFPAAHRASVPRRDGARSRPEPVRRSNRAQRLFPVNAARSACHHPPQRGNRERAQMRCSPTARAPPALMKVLAPALIKVAASCVNKADLAVAMPIRSFLGRPLCSGLKVVKGEAVRGSVRPARLRALQRKCIYPASDKHQSCASDDACFLGIHG